MQRRKFLEIALGAGAGVAVLSVPATACTSQRTNGCAPPVVPASEIRIIRVQFPTDVCQEMGANQPDGHRATIQRAIGSVGYGSTVLTVVGETDERASLSYNNRLGLQRANLLNRLLQEESNRLGGVLEFHGRPLTQGEDFAIPDGGNVPLDRAATAVILPPGTNVGLYIRQDLPSLLDHIREEQNAGTPVQVFQSRLYPS